MINITQAKEILNKYVKNEYHLIHAHMVASAMKAYASKFGKDEDKYYITGLLHDIDYGDEYDVKDHTVLSTQWLKEYDIPEDVLHAIKAHNYENTGIEPENNLDYTLVACDEISGIFHAYSLMRPQGYDGMKAKSVKKKYKDKSFAAKIDRTSIMKGIDGIGMEFMDFLNMLVETFSKEFGK